MWNTFRRRTLRHLSHVERAIAKTARRDSCDAAARSEKGSAMVTKRVLLTGAAFGLASAACVSRLTAVSGAAETFPVTRSDAEWRKLLTPAQYEIPRRGGTERPFSSKLPHEERHGLFACAGCDLDLFSSDTKADSGTGWPSF
jgi:peptide-methionine (R)-S-oxide reductase